MIWDVATFERVLTLATPTAGLSTHCHKYDDVFVAVCIFVSHDGVVLPNDATYESIFDSSLQCRTP